MIRKRWNIYGLVLWLVSSLMSSLYSQNRISDLSFQQFSLDKGLSQSNVNNILQDRRGFIWVGTHNGLNRFDGYSFEQINLYPAFSDNYIKAICENKDGDIWIGNTSGEVALIQTTSMNIVPIKVPFGPEGDRRGILEIFEDNQHRIWFCTRVGIYVYDPHKQKFYHFPPSNPVFKKLGSLASYGLVYGSQGKLWIGNQRGIIALSDIEMLENGQIKAKWEVPDSRYTYLQSGLVFGIVAAKKGGFWLNAWQKGIIYFDPEKDLYEFFPITSSEENGERVELFEIFEDTHGKLWATSKNHGLLHLDSQSKEIQYARYDANRESSLGSNTLEGLYGDDEGGIWVGAFGAGLNYVNPEIQKFRHIKAGKEPSGLSHPLVYEIYPSRFDETVWVGTHGGGFNRIRFHGPARIPEVKHYLPDPRNPGGLKDDVVISLEEDAQGNLWIGTYHGLNILPRSKALSNEEKPGYLPSLGEGKGWNILESAAIWSLLKDSKNRMWIGTNKGLFRLEEGVLAHYIQNPDEPNSIRSYYIRTLYEDSQGQIWFPSAQGLHRYRPESDDFFVYDKGEGEKGLSSPSQNCLIEDEQGRIWVGTQGSGLNVMIPGEGADYTVKNFLQTDGLPSNLIMGLLTDKKGRIWVSSSKGLARFHPDSLLQNPSHVKPHLRIYDEVDGLQSNEFLENAFSKSSWDLLYFGGVNGLNEFDPEQLEHAQREIPIFFTELKVLNQKISINQEWRPGEVLLNQDISQTDQLNLSWKDYFFSLEFSALAYWGQEKIKYAYWLEGFNEDWVEIGTQRIATFSNLSPGDYVMKVKVSKQDGGWSAREQRLNISVSTPPWKTWWAYALYVIAALIAIAGYIRYRIREQEKELQTRMRIEQAKVEEREIVRKNTAADFHDELGNKMTKISLFIELAKRAESANETLQVYLNQVEENTQVLSQGIRDFIWVLDPEKDSVYDLLLRIKDFGDELFAHTNISFVCMGIHPDQAKYKLALNKRRHLMLLVKEALNNSLKYADADEVRCQVRMDQNRLHLVLSDDGIGFEPGESKHGYGLKNMEGRAAKIGANFKLVSVVQKGTTISLDLDLPHMGD